MGKGIGAFILGGLVGAGIALLYAPRTGAETRAIVSDKLSETWGQAQDFGAQASANVQQFYQEATAKGQQLYQEATAKGQQLYQGAAAKGAEVVSAVAAKGHELYETASAKVHEAATNVKPVFAEKNDELREKIEAARQRIASQVAKNAETASDKLPVVEGAAAEAVEAPVEPAAEAAPAKD